jgi:hypothetical protein
MRRLQQQFFTLGALASLAQNEEPGLLGGEAGSGGGLGAVSCWDSGQGYREQGESGGDGGCVRITLSSSSVIAAH